MKFVMGVVFGALVAVVSVSAQAAVSDDAVIDTLLSQSAITWDNAAWLVGRAVGAFDDATTPTQAAQKAIESGWGDKDLTPKAVLDLSGYSQLLVRALAIPTGILYSWFPSGRYAFRELIFQHILTGSAHPDDKVSGERAMFLLQTAQTWKAARL